MLRKKPRLARARRERDLTSGSLTRWLITLSLPATAEILVFLTSGLIHAYWMSRLGGTALAAVTMGNTLRVVLISPMMGLSLGGMALVARHCGSREQRQADHAVMQTIVLLLGFVAVLAPIGLVGAPTFLRWMGAEGVLLEQATGYARTVFVGLLFMEMLPTMNGVIRGAGHPEYTLRNNLINVGTLLLVEPVLALGWGPVPALGVRGAALAAVLGSMAGVASQLIILRAGSAGVTLHLSDARPDPHTFRRILRLALPNSVQRLSPNLANALLLRLVSVFGAQVLTAYSLVSQVFNFFQGTAMGITNATGALVGQNLGAVQPERAERAGIRGLLLACGVNLALYGVLAVAPYAILGLLEESQAILAVAAVIAPYMLLRGVSMACSFVLVGSLSAAGDAVSGMVIRVISLWLLQLPLAWALSQPLGMGHQGIWLGVALGTSASAVAAYLRFRQGYWKTLEV